MMKLKIRKGNSEFEGSVENKKKDETKKRTSLQKAIRKAIEAEDWEMLDMLRAAAKEQGDKLFIEQLKHMGIGAGLTYVGIAIGLVGTALYNKNK